MNATIVISLDKRRAKQDGTFPLIMRLGYDNKTIAIPLGYSFKERDWDEANRKVKKSYTGTASVTRLNNAIQKKKADAMDVIVKLDEAGELERMSVSDIKQRIVQVRVQHSFFKYAGELIADLRRAKRFGTAASYQDAVSAVAKFVHGKDIAFTSITYDFLKKFEAHHLAKEGNGLNGLAVYMRAVRAIFNYAIKAGCAQREWYPFSAYTIKTVPTKKRALDVDSLRSIISLKLEPGHVLFDARNYFVASYMMYGMNFKDMALLRKSDIANGRINYRRSKTSKLYDIKLFPALQEILDYYRQLRPESVFVFPILRTEDIEAQSRAIEWARKRYNAKLKRIADTCHIEANLTSYVSRHSFATQAMLQQVPLNAISSMLGHSSLKTTEVYLKSLPNNILDDYNDRILRIA